MTDMTPEWAKDPILLPLTQAFPQFDDVKAYRTKKCLFNHDRSRLFNVVSPRYHLITHSSLLGAIEKAIARVWPGQEAVRTVRSINAGARVVAQFKLPWLPTLKLRGDDEIIPLIETTNSYDSAWQLSLGMGAFRLVCSNGMYVGVRFGGLAGKHFPHLEAEAPLEETVHQIASSGEDLLEVFDSWHDTRYTYEEARHLLPEGIFPAKYLDPIMQPDRFPRTKWDLYNDFTEMASHQVRSLNRRLEFGRQIASIFFVCPDEPRMKKDHPRALPRRRL